MVTDDYQPFQYNRYRVTKKVAPYELPGHRFCIIVRTDKLNSSAPKMIRGACSCRKWTAAEWYPTRELAKRAFIGHAQEAAKQGVLF